MTENTREPIATAAVDRATEPALDTGLNAGLAGRPSTVANRHLFIEPETLARIPSPALVIFRDQVRRNIVAAVNLAGRPGRLRPHVKTTKMSAMIRLLAEYGIGKVKCATLAEAEMAAAAGCRDIVIAYQLVGPAAVAFAELRERFPQVDFQPVVDCPAGVKALAAHRGDRTLRVLVDLDVGMHRTGIEPGAPAEDLYAALAAAGLQPGGLHAYDGHLTDSDRQVRCRQADAVFERVDAVRRRLAGRGLAVPRVIFSGTPAFPCHAARGDDATVELSPGTFVLHDWGYASRFPDLPFQPAAAVLGRVISRRAGDTGAGSVQVTVDIGSKAIAADPAGARGSIVGRPEAQPQSQSEEHWVFAVPGPQPPTVGDTVLVIPTHICPTVAWYEFAHVIDADGRVAELWPIDARRRAYAGPA